MESIIPNLRHRWGDGDARKIGAIRESPFPNLRHRCGDDGVFTSTYQSIALRLNYGITFLSRVIKFIVFEHSDAREGGAIRESTFPNLRN